jgi:hypothetical protein
MFYHGTYTNTGSAAIGFGLLQIDDLVIDSVNTGVFNLIAGLFCNFSPAKKLL